MLGTPPFVSPTAHAVSELVTRLREWPVASQQQARRNAMVAATACAQRRSEREDVADFMDSLRASETSATDTQVTASEASSSRAAHV